MELRQLRTFMTAAELKNFTRAAEVLSLTQAAVSQHVAALEKEFRVSLFERGGRSVAPTEAGRRLYEIARDILALVEMAHHEVGSEETTVRGTLSIAASTVPAETLLPELLLRFREQHPEVHESVIVSDSAEATQAVASGKAEIGFVGELPRGSRLDSTTVGQDELVLIVSADHPLAVKKKTTLAQLRAEPLIVREPGSGSRRCVEQALENAGVSPNELNIVVQMNSNDAIRLAVQKGMGAAFLSRSLVERDIADKRLAKLTVPGVRPRRHLYLLSDPERIPTAPHRAFLDFLEDWLHRTGDCDKK